MFLIKKLFATKSGRQNRFDRKEKPKKINFRSGKYRIQAEYVLEYKGGESDISAYIDDERTKHKWRYHGPGALYGG